jgi:group I intron endonuclease
MASGIYKITNTINQKVYIGSAVDLERREKQHFKCSHNFPLRRAMKKYGAENFQFDILVLCQPDDLTFVEQDQLDYWKKVKGWKNMYNICPTAGSSLGMKFGPRSKETKQKLSEAHKGKQFSEDHKRKLSEAHKGKQHTEAAKQKMSEARKGKCAGKKHPRYDQTIYNFVHKDGRTFTGTVYELRTKYGLNKGNLFSVLSGKYNSTGGWSLT